jgi:group I intron endonuclease
MKSGIYTITCLVNNKIYVGKSINVEKRLSQHYYELSTKRHKNGYLRSSWEKYGEKFFKFELLEECDKEFLSSFEHYWCNILNSHNSKYGYNIATTNPCINHFEISEKTRQNRSKALSGKPSKLKGIKRNPSVVEKTANSLRGLKRSAKIRKQLSEAHKIPILQYDRFTGNFIREWDSYKSANEGLGISSTASASKKRGYVKNWFFIRKTSEFIEPVLPIPVVVKYIPDKTHREKIKLGMKNIKRFYKPVVQLDLDYNLISCYKSIKEAHVLSKVHFTTINRSLKNKGNTRNFIWMYKEDYEKRVVN